MVSTAPDDQMATIKVNGWESVISTTLVWMETPRYHTGIREKSLIQNLRSARIQQMHVAHVEPYIMAVNENSKRIVKNDLIFRDINLFRI